MLLLQYCVQEAVKGQFWRLRDKQGKPPGVVGWWPSRAVTFLDNHDTGSTQVHAASIEESYDRDRVPILGHCRSKCLHLLLFNLH